MIDCDEIMHTYSEVHVIAMSHFCMYVRLQLPYVNVIDPVSWFLYLLRFFYIQDFDSLEVSVLVK